MPQIDIKATLWNWSVAEPALKVAAHLPVARCRAVEWEAKRDGAPEGVLTIEDTKARFWSLESVRNLTF